MDIISPEKRSDVMRRVKSKNTKPELRVRSLIHSMGYRYRLHVQSLPGRPDIVFPSKKKVILVHGCFWHGHKGCPNFRMPHSNTEYWNKKIEGNINKDMHNERMLQELGYSVLVVWECELKDIEKVKKIIKKFLG